MVIIRLFERTGHLMKKEIGISFIAIRKIHYSIGSSKIHWILMQQKVLAERFSSVNGRYMYYTIHKR